MTSFSHLQLWRRTKLEYTTVINGFVADYFAPMATSNMGPFTMIVDIPNNKAAIPGMGNVPVSFTHSVDVVRFTASLLGVPKWPKKSYIIGETLTWNEFVATAEESKGIKFDVAYDSVEKLEKLEVTELPGHQALYAYMPKQRVQGFNAQFGLLFEKGYFNLKSEQTLTDVKARGMRELMMESWKAY